MEQCFPSVSKTFSSLNGSLGDYDDLNDRRTILLAYTRRKLYAICWTITGFAKIFMVHVCINTGGHTDSYAVQVP